MRLALLATAATVLASLLVSGTGAVTGRKAVRTAGPVEAIALAGAVAAYDVHAVGVRCNRLYVWRVRTGTRAQIGGRETCRADGTSTGSGVTRIALDGTRAAWIVNRGGNSEAVDDLYASPLSRPSERRRARAIRTGEVGAALAGGWLGGLVSDGTTIFYNRWTTSVDATGREAVVSGSLRRLTRAGTAETASGGGTLLAQAASGGRVAVLRADGAAALYEGATGRLLRAVTPSAPGRAVALSGQRLVVLTSAGALELFGTGTGAQLKTWRAAGKVSTRIDLAGRVLAYAVGTRVHVLDVVNGRTAVIASPKRRIVDVQIEASGVLFAYNSPSGKAVGNVVFVPAGAVSAALR